MFKIDGKNPFVCDENEFSGVKKIADKVCIDVERVTGKKPAVSAVVEPVESRSQSDLTEFAGTNSPQNTVYFATISPANASATFSLSVQTKL